MSNQYLFNSVPTIHMRRSQQDLSHLVKTSMNVGTLYPLDVQEVYPGDTMKITNNFVTRLTSTFLRPVIDNLFLDSYTFFVPSRLLYDKWAQIFGENKASAWANAGEYSAPVLGGADDRRVHPKTVASYLGLPVGAPTGSTVQPLSTNIPINILPFRGFAKIYEDWFRDENNVQPMHIHTGEYVDANDGTGEGLNALFWSPSNYTGYCPPVAKLHDYFTSALPSPQKGSAPLIPVQGGGNQQYVPVQPHYVGALPVTEGVPLTFVHAKTVQDSSTGSALEAFDVTNGKVYATSAGWSGYNGAVADNPIVGTNLAAKLSDLNVGGINVSDLRMAVQTQKMLERDARGGTRYIEYIRSAFGVSSPDARLQRSEFLGGRRMPISITQVTQTTGDNSETSPLGAQAAYSLSGGSTRINKSFVEHGYVFTVACIRHFHTYQQGVERFWTRRNRLDYYDPVFANISEQPVYTSELFAFGETSSERRIFGYQEAWADLRNRQNRVSGQLSTNVGDSLDVWHFADFYRNAPVLGPSFIEEKPDFVNRTISVSSDAQDQFIVDLYIQNKAVRVMPVRSIPGLVDHH